MSERYPHLFSPLQIGPVTARNRIMQTAHVKLFTTDGIDSLRNVAYQVERAKGGAGLLITGNRLDPPHLDDGHGALRLPVPQGRARDRPQDDERRARARRAHLRAAQPLRAQRHERLGGRPARALGPVGGQVAGLRRDAEGDGARGHRRGRRVVGALGGARPRGRLRRHRGAHRAQLPPAPVPLAGLQQARRRVRRVAREPAALHARGDRRGAPAHRRRLGDRHPPDALGVHGRGRARHRGREGDGAAARVVVQARLRQRQRGRLPQHLQGDRALRRAGRLPRRPQRPGEGEHRPPGVHDRRHQGSGARRGDPRRGPGRHGRDDARADRRPGVREQGARGARGRDHALHPRQPGLHRARLQGPVDQLHRQPGGGPRGALRRGDARAGRAGAALARRRRRARGHARGGDADAARARGHARRGAAGARRADQPDPEDARPRDVRQRAPRPRAPARQARRRRPARDARDAGAGGRDRLPTPCSSPPARCRRRAGSRRRTRS